jgi:hypothetical protein
MFFLMFIGFFLFFFFSFLFFKEDMVILLSSYEPSH